MPDERPTFGSLFAGIGGIDLGLERAGWECRWQVEWDAYCQRVLAKHWPDVPRYGDITAVDWSGVERVDLLAGGFPCQPVSIAGKRRGTEDERWLWPAFEDAVRHLRPKLLLVENVPGLLVGGGMDDVLGGLAELGYDATWASIPAAAVGAPHLRYRVWIVAHRAELGWPLADADDRGPFDAFRPGRYAARDGGSDVAEDGPDPTGQRWGWGDESRADLERDGLQPPQLRPSVADPEIPGLEGWQERRHSGSALTGPGQGGRSVGGQWSSEPDVGRVAHGVPSRVDRLRALGNAVVPQVVEVIGRQLLEVML